MCFFCGLTHECRSFSYTKTSSSPLNAPVDKSIPKLELQILQISFEYYFKESKLFIQKKKYLRISCGHVVSVMNHHLLFLSLNVKRGTKLVHIRKIIELSFESNIDLGSNTSSVSGSKSASGVQRGSIHKDGYAGMNLSEKSVANSSDTLIICGV